MGELKQVYLLIQQEIVKNNVKGALDTFNIHYDGIKDVKGFQNFTVSVVSTLAQKLQSELASPNQNILNTNYVIQFADCCFKILVLSELQSLQNSLYVIVRYLLVNNHATEAVYFTSYLLKKSSSPCGVLKNLVQLFAHYILKMCPVDDDLKKLSVMRMWDTVLNLVKCCTEKEIEYALNSLTTLVKNMNGLILHEGRSMDLVILDMTLESVLSSSVFRKKSNEKNMMNLYSMLIENIACVMQNMMRNKQMHIHFLTKHIELMIDVCCLDKTEKETLSFLASLFKFIDNSIKNGLDSNFELRKMIQFVQKYESTAILPNTILQHVLKASIVTITKLKNLWYEGLIINSPETISQIFVLLQQLVFISKQSLFSQICCKNCDCDLNEDSTSEISLINIVFIIIRHTFTTHIKFLNVGDVQKWMDLFTSLFERVSKSKCSNKISFIEFSLISAYNLCIMVPSEFTNVCLDFLKNIYAIFDPCGIDPDLVARVAVLLSRYLYSSNKHNEALKFIAYWCVRTRSELAAQQWVYLKFKEERSNRPVNETILNMFENDDELKKKWPNYCLKKSDSIEIMWLELKSHNHQYKIKQNTTPILELFNELMGNKLPKELKCRIIITTAYVILHSNSINGLKTLIDVLEDYIPKLEVELSIEKNSMPLMLGNLYYANFMCLTKHLQSLVTKQLDLYTEERLERGMEQQNTILYESMSWILPLKIKPKLFNCLKWAIKNWSAVENDTLNDEFDVKMLYKSLQEVAFIFKLHCNPKEVEVWQLLYKLASNKKCHQYMFIALSELMKIGEIDDLELNNLVKHLPNMAIDYKLAVATSLLSQSKFNDAQTLLETIDKKELDNNVLLSAECAYLRSRISFESGKFNTDKCLSMFIEAYNISHCLIKRLDSFTEYLSMHLVVLNICAYLNLIYINMFKPIEARCFLKVQMSIVLKSVLTQRALNVFIMNCWNDLMCCNFENANGQLEHVMTLLDFKEDDLESKIQKLSINSSPNIMSSPLSNYRSMPNRRTKKIGSPSMKQFNDKSVQMSITDFCEDTIINKKKHDSIIILSVIEACTLKAVYCSKLNQKQIAENYFKLAFKLIKLNTLNFNKNEVYNILSERQNSVVNYHYAEHLIFFNNLSKASDYIKKTKKSFHDEWLTLNMNELYILLQMNDIMKNSKPNVVHSPVAKAGNNEFKTPAITKILVNTKSQPRPRFVTPVVRKLKMTLESPRTRDNQISSPSIIQTEKTKKDSAVKKKTGKENIVKSTTKGVEIEVREKRSTRKKEVLEQPPLVIKTRSNRLNI